ESEYAAALATLVPGNAGGGSVTVNGQVYTWSGFDELVNALTLILQQNPEADIEITVEETPTATPYCADIAVQVFQQPDGSIDVYSGFSDADPNGFLV